MSDEAPSTDSGPDVLWLFLPIGVGIAIAINAGPAWLSWAFGSAVAFTCAHILSRSWHYRQWRAAAGAKPSNGVYFALRLGVEAVKIVLPIVVVFVVRGPPFRIGSSTPWPAQAKVEYINQCATDLLSQGQPLERAVPSCSCIANALEAEFGTEQYAQMVEAQPRPRGSGIEQRLFRALRSCPLDSK